MLQYRKKQKIIFLILIVLWLIFIYAMSAKTGEQSDGLSKGIVNDVLSLMPGFNQCSVHKQNSILNGLNLFIRKSAHFTEFGILALLTWGFLSAFNYFEEKIRKNSFKAILVCSVLFIFLCASLDEIHQGFVGGRSPKVSDVGIDTAGAITFGFILKGIIKIKRRKK